MSDNEQVEEIFQPDLFINTSYKLDAIHIGNVQVQLYALHSSATTDHDLTGQILWPAAKILALYLTTQHDLCRHSSFVELGAGAGLAGIVAAKLLDDASNIVLTDNNDLVLDLLNRNIEVNFSRTRTKPICARLSWGTDEVDEFIGHHGDYDVIIGADVVFWPTAVPLLFETVKKMLDHRPSARFLLSYVVRSNYTTKLLFSEAEKNGLRWEEHCLAGDVFAETLAANNLSIDKAKLFSFTLGLHQETE